MKPNIPTQIPGFLRKQQVQNHGEICPKWREVLIEAAHNLPCRWQLHESRITRSFQTVSTLGCLQVPGCEFGSSISCVIRQNKKQNEKKPYHNRPWSTKTHSGKMMHIASATKKFGPLVTIRQQKSKYVILNVKVF